MSCLRKRVRADWKKRNTVTNHDSMSLPSTQRRLVTVKWNKSSSDRRERIKSALTGSRSSVLCGSDGHNGDIFLWVSWELCCSSSVELLHCQPRLWMGGTIVKWATAAGKWSTPSTPLCCTAREEEREKERRKKKKKPTDACSSTLSLGQEKCKVTR